MKQFLNSQFVYAVVGASRNHEKYGHKVLRDLAEAGWKVVGVHPTETDIDGVPVFSGLNVVTPKPDVAVVVVPPAVGLHILDDAKAAGITRLWFQPGAESPDIVQHAKELGLEIQADGACIMVARRHLG